MYLINQLPIPRLPTNHPISQTLVPLTARLTCVDERFAPLWEELAKHHPATMSLQWHPTSAAIDPSERAQVRAEIDAIVADLYQLSEHDFVYILNTFPLLDREQPPLPGEDRSFITRDSALLALFTLRGKTPPTDIITFFSEAGVDIGQRTGARIDLAERVQIATQVCGAVAYQPGGRDKEEDTEDDALEGDEQDEDEEEE